MDDAVAGTDGVCAADVCATSVAVENEAVTGSGEEDASVVKLSLVTSSMDSCKARCKAISFASSIAFDPLGPLISCIERSNANCKSASASASRETSFIADGGGTCAGTGGTRSRREYSDHSVTL